MYIIIHGMSLLIMVVTQIELRRLKIVTMVKINVPYILYFQRDFQSNNLHLNNEIPTLVKRQNNVHKSIQAYCLACWIAICLYCEFEIWALLYRFLIQFICLQLCNHTKRQIAHVADVLFIVYHPCIQNSYILGNESIF